MTALQRFENGLAVGLRGGIYRYDPVGLGGRVGLTLGLGKSLWRGADARLDTETAYLQGEFEAPEASYTGAAVQGDVALVVQHRLPLLGSVDLRPSVGPYVVATSTFNVWDVSDPAVAGSSFEETTMHGGVQVGAALTFALLDARVAIAPVARFPLAQTRTPAAFSATPGAGIWVDF